MTPKSGCNGKKIGAVKKKSARITCHCFFFIMQCPAYTFALATPLCCAFIFFMMFIFNKYSYQAQRLLLYLTTAVMLLCISFVVRGFGYSLIHNTKFCMAVAFISQYSGGCILGAVICIISNIFVLAVLKKDKWNLEPLYIVSIFVIPAAIDWLPFISSAYGPTRSWCWIRNLNLDTCDTFVYGLVLQYTLWYVPSITVCTVGGIVYLVSLFSIKKQKRSYTAVVEPMSQQL